MLKVEVERAQDNKEESVYTIGLLDPRCPNGRSLNFLMTASWEGLNAMIEALTIVRDGQPKAHLQEGPRGTTEYPEEG